MTVGTNQYKGMAVPLRGESELIQITAATDFITLTGASSISGDFIVCRDSTGATEYFRVEASGKVVSLGDATFSSTVTAVNVVASTLLTATKDLSVGSSATAATVTGSTLVAATKDATVGSTLTVGNLITATKDASVGSTLTVGTLITATKDATVGSTLTAAKLAGALSFSSAPVFTTIPDIAAGARIATGKYLRFSVPLTTSTTGNALTTGLTLGDMLLVVKSGIYQIAVCTDTTQNTLTYFTANTATFGRGTPS